MTTDRIRVVLDALEQSVSASAITTHPQTAKHFRMLEQLLLLNQVPIQSTDEVECIGAFDVELLKGNDRITLAPRIRIRRSLPPDNASPALVLLHEVGHFVLHCSWVAEMRLLSFVCDRMRDELDMARGAALHAVLDAAQKRLVWFFSSIEQSADRLACSVLLPNDYMTLLWRTCREEDGVRIFDLLHLAETRLGIPLTGRLSERFNPLIMERLPQHIGWDSVIAGRSEQRQLGERVSRRRAELLLKQLWSEFGSVLGAASVQNSTHRSRANAATHGGTFFFGGLECR